MALSCRKLLQANLRLVSHKMAPEHSPHEGGMRTQRCVCAATMPHANADRSRSGHTFLVLEISPPGRRESTEETTSPPTEPHQHSALEKRKQAKCRIYFLCHSRHFCGGIPCPPVVVGIASGCRHGNGAQRRAGVCKMKTRLQSGERNIQIRRYD
jgi:hypothetical protein